MARGHTNVVPVRLVLYASILFFGGYLFYLTFASTSNTNKVIISENIKISESQSKDTNSDLSLTNSDLSLSVPISPQVVDFNDENDDYVKSSDVVEDLEDEIKRLNKKLEESQESSEELEQQVAESEIKKKKMEEEEILKQQKEAEDFVETGETDYYEDRGDVFSKLEYKKINAWDKSKWTFKQTKEGLKKLCSQLPKSEQQICEDVTIVISYKDIFKSTLQNFEEIYKTTPKVPIIYITSEPMIPSVKKWLKEEESRNEFLTVIDSGRYFANPYSLRNMIIKYLACKYIMYTFNDLKPVNDKWLTTLYEDNEANYAAIDVQQPFIYEPKMVDGKFVPDLYQGHGFWKGLLFDKFPKGKDGAEFPLREKHKYDMSYKKKKPQKMVLEEIPFHIEDHIFFVKREAVLKQSFMDPAACYAKEFLDMALNAKYLGIRFWHNPRSIVKYIQPGEDIDMFDIKSFAVRRSEAVGVGSVAYIRKKWNLMLPWDHIDASFIQKNYKGIIHFEEAQIDKDDIELQVEMAANTFAMMGYDDYRMTVDGETYDDLNMADMYMNTMRNVKKDSQVISLKGAWAQRPFDYKLGGVDYLKRQKMLQEGKLFKIKKIRQGHSTAVTLAQKKNNYKSFNDFVMIEIQNYKISDNDELKLLMADASMVTKNAEGQYSFYYYVGFEEDNLNQSNKLAIFEDAIAEASDEENQSLFQTILPKKHIHYHYCFKHAEKSKHCNFEIEIKKGDFNIVLFQMVQFQSDSFLKTLK